MAKISILLTFASMSATLSGLAAAEMSEAYKVPTVNHGWLLTAIACYSIGSFCLGAAGTLMLRPRST